MARIRARKIKSRRAPRRRDVVGKRKIKSHNARRMRNINRTLGGSALGGAVGLFLGGGRGALGGALIGGGIGALTR